ncbi:hypothetical protein [Streptomyces clavuligerus]|uniref:hypothetical protein n=1 Tax=Streptomyces clavuligerus TaxID=1901 RepID=UPI00020D95B2|nr:hypothetical protein [Streptomyces clavuligerus]ANW22475.1 hypothetical protein BB341_29625 [Streptomyces clavuligerus]AXU17378.1 hypothetical protein D1794_32755 [Streptomyces clavuligerus]MBY6306960.1 hypothetical protein [Streptomyces clavuligerus]QCS10454.1 hypothetical protein CRV15_33470 [Streptomyces clavuligerus]QPJ97505.1 hypothetical protein GE265_31005 [Streptomyces clavuligerus]
MSTTVTPKRIGTAAAVAAMVVASLLGATSTAQATPSATAATTAAAPETTMAAWERWGTFSQSTCVSWGQTLLRNGQIYSYLCSPIGLGMYELWVVRR